MPVLSSQHASLTSNERKAKVNETTVDSRLTLSPSPRIFINVNKKVLNKQLVNGEDIGIIGKPFAVLSPIFNMDFQVMIKGERIVF